MNGRNGKILHTLENPWARRDIVLMRACTSSQGRYKTNIAALCDSRRSPRLQTSGGQGDRKPAMAGSEVLPTTGQTIYPCSA